MKYVEVVAGASSVETIKSIAVKVKAVDVRVSAPEQDNLCQMRLLINDETLQATLDALQNVLGAQPFVRIVVLPVEISLPKPIETKQQEKKKDDATAAREALYAEVEKGARANSNFFLLVVLSTIVAAIGLIENNVAVVIGAMVIAPLLGPNLALSLGTTLGDVVLMRKSIKTLLLGLLLATSMSVVFGFIWPGSLDSHELMSRTDASLDSIALALASGAAATLSLTTGLSSVLVGVMVAVAILPPAVTVGIMLGNGNMPLAFGAALLLAINIVCVNLSSKLVFLYKDISPRTWLEKETAKSAMFRYLIGWFISLIAFTVFIYLT
ncbi:hypothetical protein PALB_24720 [Pseudoalteromonas luteoviolacea B = ATCC 29581]|nr:hypothetical protein PALB_24720 [Pseudoalteromonas luteoviolacea B = ATCC 29581]